MNVIQFSVNFSAQAAQGMERDILREFAGHINRGISGAIPAVLKDTERMISEFLTTSPAWASLKNGELKRLLAVDMPEIALSQIEANIITGLQLTHSPATVSGSSIKGGFSVSLLNDSYSEALSFSGIAYSTINGVQVTWLEWLLFYGTAPVLRGLKLEQTPRGVFARKSNSDLSIPAEFAGIPGDNFLTRALQPLEVSMATMIQTEVSRRT